MGTYRTAQICQNGHVVVEALEVAPELASQFCSECGAATMIACPTCKERIRGDYYEPGVITLGVAMEAPAYCHACGKAYPWTADKLEAARALADELEGLSNAERDELKAALPDLVSETPRSKVAVVRVQKWVAKATGSAVKAFRDIAVDIAAETIKRQLWPGS